MKYLLIALCCGLLWTAATVTAKPPPPPTTVIPCGQRQVLASQTITRTHQGGSWYAFVNGSGSGRLVFAVTLPGYLWSEHTIDGAVIQQNMLALPAAGSPHADLVSVEAVAGACPGPGLDVTFIRFQLDPP